MNGMDEELRRALVRRDPSPDFTARVLAASQTRAAEPGLLRSWLSRLLFGRWAAVAATTLIVGGGIAYQQHERDVQGETAKQKLLVALQIAGMKLQGTQRHVLSGGER